MTYNLERRSASFLVLKGVRVEPEAMAHIVIHTVVQELEAALSELKALPKGKVRDASRYSSHFCCSLDVEQVHEPSPCAGCIHRTVWTALPEHQAGRSATHLQRSGEVE